MMMLSHGRVRPNNRLSVLDLDIAIAESPEFSPNCSVGSYQSTSSASFRSSPRDKASYNTQLLHKIKINGLRITAEEVYRLRREFQEDFASKKTGEAKRKCLLGAIDVLSELKHELRDEIKSEHLPFFVYEYQALVCWIYSVIRFAPYMSEMERHWNNLKAENRLILSALHPRSEHFLLAVLRFSHMCLEYAPFCDVESLEWCRTAVLRASPRRKSVHSTYRSDSSMSSSSSTSESIDDFLSKRDEERRHKLVEDLRININEIELAMSTQLPTGLHEKLVN